MNKSSCPALEKRRLKDMQKVKIIRDFHSTYMKTFPFAPRAAKSKGNSGKKNMHLEIGGN